MINFIRTIHDGSNAGSRNIFRFAWIRYNLAWLKKVDCVRNAMDTNQIPPVLIFENKEFSFQQYYRNLWQFEAIDKDILKSVPRCCHPSYIKHGFVEDFNKGAHCLSVPKTAVNIGKDEFCCNDSVKDFVNFINAIDTQLLCCPTCNNNCVALVKPTVVDEDESPKKKLKVVEII